MPTKNVQTTHETGSKEVLDILDPILQRPKPTTNDAQHLQMLEEAASYENMVESDKFLELDDGYFDSYLEFHEDSVLDFFFSTMIVIAS